MRKAAITVTIVVVIAVASISTYLILTTGNTSGSVAHTSHTASGRGLSIIYPKNGTEESIYYASPGLQVQGTTDLGPGNWLYDPPHTVDLVTPTGSQCSTSSATPAPYLSILDASVFDRASEISPVYKLEQAGVSMYMYNLSALLEPSSIGAGSLGWFFHFDFSGEAYYAGIFMQTNSNGTGTQNSEPPGVTYWYGPWAGSRPAGETETNGSINVQTAGLSEMDVYFPATAVGNLTRGDTLTDMGLLTFAGAGKSPDSGQYCTNDSVGGDVSYTLFDYLLPSGTIQVSAEPSCQPPRSPASLNWTEATIINPDDPNGWQANVPVSGGNTPYSTVGPFTVLARELQNGSVVEGPVSVANVTVSFYNFGTTSTSAGQTSTTQTQCPP